MDDLLEVGQLKLQFPTEEACAAALFQARWPNGFRCPKCGCARAYPIKTRKHYQCADCRYQTSLTAGTILENTRTPLYKWFVAMLLLSRPAGISATSLRLILQVTYKTAWTMLMKIRCAMSRDSDRQLLSGAIRMNAALYGQKMSPTLSHLATGEHHVMIGASLNEVGKPEHIKIKRIAANDTRGGSALSSSVDAFKKRYVDPSSVDVQSVYRRFSADRFSSLISLVRQAERWVYKTFIAIGAKHLQKYLDEYCYRFNNGVGHYNTRNHDVHDVRTRPVVRFRDIREDEIRNKINNAPPNNTVELHHQSLMVDGMVFRSLLKVCAVEHACTYREIVHGPPLNSSRNFNDQAA